MQGLRAVIAMLITLAFANGTLWRTLSENLAAGVYPPEADSISIPLFEALTVSLVILLALGLSVSLPKRTLPWVVARAIPAALAVLLSLMMSASWLTPKHYEVAASFLLVAMAGAWSWWQDQTVRRRKSDSDRDALSL